MCVSVSRLRSCVVLRRRSRSDCCRFIGIGGPGTAAMAPALTQATHQRQTLTLRPASPLSMDTLSSVEESHLKQFVWPPQCCGAPIKLKEIARSDNLSPGDGQETALDPPLGKSQALASTLLNPPSLDQRTDSAENGSVTNSSTFPITQRNVNGKTMGLQRTAGDLVDLNSPLTPTIKGLRSDWPSPKQVEDCPTVLPEIFSSDHVDVDNVDDIFEVINCMDVETDSTAQCPINSASEDLEALNKLSIAEQQLLHEAAEAAMDVVDDTTKEMAVGQKLEQVRCKQQRIEQRCQSLLRRAGLMQSRRVSRHVADQVTNFVRYAKDTLGVKRDGRGSGGCNLYGWAEDGRLPTREEVRNIPTSTLVNLVSRLQAPPISYLSNRRYFGLGKLQSISSSRSIKSWTRLSTEVAETLEEVAGLWEAQLRYLQRHDDPDATESSSGGESDDDSPVLEQQQQPEQPDGTTPPVQLKPVSTYQRAAWRWARDRAAIAARWSWLQAQVADLEYRIRQHTDVYRQLRAAKGAVHLGVPCGFNSSPIKTECEQETDVCLSSRTRPLTCNGTFRKRRLVKTTSLSTLMGRKASRHSTVRCGCVLSRISSPCVLCGGRNNHILSVDPDGMTIKERIGLVDRGFHPVLSLPQDIPLSAHVDSILKSGDWRTPPPSTASSNRRGTKGDDDSSKKKSFKRKHNKTAEEGDFNGKLDRRKLHIKRKRKSTAPSDLLDEDSNSTYPPSSPCPSGEGSFQNNVANTPGRSVRERSVMQDLMRRRTSYDIDNIVIPYSMAATTRVERLQYKEILTPKWRVVDDELMTDQQGVHEEEDVSEEACIARHERSENEERRKFMSYLKQPSGPNRGRRRVDRIDSRAESSGANTPDPMSPHEDSKCISNDLMTKQEKVDVLDVVGDIDPDEGDFSAGFRDEFKDAFQHPFSVSSIKERRRTASLTKKDIIWKFVHDDNSMSYEMDEVSTVAPYDPRVFPLSDNVYAAMVAEMPAEEVSHCDEDLSQVTQLSCRHEKRTSLTLAGDNSHPVTPTAALSDSAESPSLNEVEEDDDPNDPEWEGSQGSVPKTKKR